MVAGDTATRFDRRTSAVITRGGVHTYVAEISPGGRAVVVRADSTGTSILAGPASVAPEVVWEEDFASGIAVGPDAVYLYTDSGTLAEITLQTPTLTTLIEPGVPFAGRTFSSVPGAGISGSLLAADDAGDLWFTATEQGGASGLYRWDGTTLHTVFQLGDTMPGASGGLTSAFVAIDTGTSAYAAWSGGTDGPDAQTGAWSGSGSAPSILYVAPADPVEGQVAGVGNLAVRGATAVAYGSVAHGVDGTGRRAALFTVGAASATVLTVFEEPLAGANAATYIGGGNVYVDANGSLFHETMANVDGTTTRVLLSDGGGSLAITAVIGDALPTGGTWTDFRSFATRQGGGLLVTGMADVAGTSVPVVAADSGTGLSVLKTGDELVDLGQGAGPEAQAGYLLNPAFHAHDSGDCWQLDTVGGRTAVECVGTVEVPLEVDVAVALTDEGDGDFAVTLTNTGIPTWASYDVEVASSPPVGVLLDDARCEAASTAGVFVCRSSPTDLSVLAEDEQVSFGFSLASQPDGGTVTFTATATASAGDSVDTATTTLVASPDPVVLADLALRTAPCTADALCAVLTNLGPDDATDVQLDAGRFAVEGDDVDGLAVGEEVELMVRPQRVDAGDDTLEITLSVTASSTDPDPSNNALTETVAPTTPGCHAAGLPLVGWLALTGLLTRRRRAGR